MENNCNEYPQLDYKVTSGDPDDNVLKYGRFIYDRAGRSERRADTAAVR